MIRIVVSDVTPRGIRRDNDQRDTGAVAEEVHRLHVSGIVVAAALILGDEDGGVLPQ